MMLRLAKGIPGRLPLRTMMSIPRPLFLGPHPWTSDGVSSHRKMALSLVSGPSDRHSSAAPSRRQRWWTPDGIGLYRKRMQNMD